MKLRIKFRKNTNRKKIAKREKKIKRSKRRKNIHFKNFGTMRNEISLNLIEFQIQRLKKISKNEFIKKIPEKIFLKN